MRIIRRKILKSRRLNINSIINNDKLYIIDIISKEEKILKERKEEIKKRIKEIIKKLSSIIKISKIIEVNKKIYDITSKGILVRMGKGKGKSIGKMEITKSNNKLYSIIISIKDIKKERIIKILKESFKNESISIIVR